MVQMGWLVLKLKMSQVTDVAESFKIQWQISNNFGTQIIIIFSFVHF